MKIFLDTASVDEIREGVEMGLVDGVTTNPTLASKETGKGKGFADIVKEILKITPGPVSIEVVATDYEGMVKQGQKIAQLGQNAVVKIPMTRDGLKAIKTLKGKNIPVNCTLIFTPVQALFAAKAGAEYVSPFVGRLDDITQDGMELVNQIKTIFVNYNIKTNILVASVRNPVHVLRAALIGADVVTLPFDVLKKLPDHPKTDEGLSRFLSDWKKVSPNGDFPL
ncbi:MAG TPA: fructose-6-phosphate aldolase [Thermoplasmataceae archaeon]|nr:fructose-6-phosphate aldolase [Thermoplasmatales archaeon AK]HLH86183.1 fructose-6-phosphate aldolase [Thermoplasmataceae archaeon]